MKIKLRRQVKIVQLNFLISQTLDGLKAHSQPIHLSGEQDIQLNNTTYFFIKKLNILIYFFLSIF